MPVMSRTGFPYNDPEKAVAKPLLWRTTANRSFNLTVFVIQPRQSLNHHSSTVFLIISHQFQFRETRTPADEIPVQTE